MFELQARRARGIAFAEPRSTRAAELVRADEKRLRQILINLLGNAVKFTRGGGRLPRALMRARWRTFEIEDTGPGMPPEELARLRAPSRAGRRRPGAGAGRA